MRHYISKFLFVCYGGFYDFLNMINSLKCCVFNSTTTKILLRKYNLVPI
uniref:Uncharacterized protein n=1 Tax=Arundo donax TaxID=35708 RepID=A0A0A9A1E3_ARUDO